VCATCAARTIRGMIRVFEDANYCSKRCVTAATTKEATDA
jgi:hypothetical protein